MSILNMSLSAAFLIIAIVLIRALMLHKLPKRTFLALWFIALCRLLVPVSISSRFSIYTLASILRETFFKANTAPTMPNMTAFPSAWAVPDITAPTLAGTVSTASAGLSPVSAIWLLGLSVCILAFLVTHLRCRWDYKTALPIDNEFVIKWLSEHPTRRRMQIRQSDKIAAPLTYGLFRPIVLLPKTTDWTEETKLRYILTHEYVHIRRLDILLKWLLTAALCVHWFNPFVWVMYILANRDIELSCDEAVVRTFGETAKSAYALTLIGLEEKKSRLTPLVNNFSKYAIEERINAIMKMKKTSIVGIILAIALVIGTTTAFATNAARTADISAALEVLPTAAPIRTPNTAPTASPQNDSTKIGTVGSAAKQPSSKIKEAPVSQTSTPANEDSGKETSDNSYDGYAMDKNGWWTYGNTSMRDALGLDYDADLMEAIGTDGQSGYIRTKDRESNTPSAPDEYRTIPLFDVNGYVLGAFVLSYSNSVENGAYISAAQEPAYPRNSKGETYGNVFMQQALGCAPDLVAATGTAGQSGYIRESDSPGANVSTLEEAAEYMEWLKTQPTTIMIPLYDQEGNVIGEFGESNGGNDKHYDSLEEAREAVEKGS